MKKYCQNFYNPPYRHHSYIFLQCHNANKYEQEQTIYSFRIDLKFMCTCMLPALEKTIYFQLINLYRELF